MSFNNQAYVTTGFQTEIPMVAQVFILSEINMISTLDSSEVDYLQVFELNRKIIAGQVFQEIVVKQEQPLKEHSICFQFDDAVTQRVYCIDAEDYHTFMLSSEY